MSDPAENMLIAGLDQSWTACVEAYDAMSPSERGELALWLSGAHGALRSAPDDVLLSIGALAASGLLEVGLRWSNRQAAE